VFLLKKYREMCQHRTIFIFILLAQNVNGYCGGGPDVETSRPKNQTSILVANTIFFFY
jgi:hypothetical protein